MEQIKHTANSHITFDEVSKQVHHLRDVILWDIECGFGQQSQCNDIEEVCYTNHLMFSKFWFIRVSSVNKKRFCLILLEDDIPCAWTLSLLLKSIWNCRPKDAFSSQYEAVAWSSYDQTPMDHNRSAMPLEVLVQVMESDRRFFRNLDPSRKAQFLLELLKVAGGPVVWAVFHKAQTIFETYREEQLQNLQDSSIAVIEKQESRVKASMPMDDKKMGDDLDTFFNIWLEAALNREDWKSRGELWDTRRLKQKGKNQRRKISVSGAADTGPSFKQPGTQDAQRELEICLAQWTSIIKSVKDNQKLEEVELSFSDGTKKRIWKVNRPKPEVTETVDYLQLLPLAVAKRILNFVPRTQLTDCARVNRYWAFLVDELKAELSARLKIDLDIEKLTDIMLRHDTIDQSMDTFKTVTTTSYSALVTRQCKRLNFSKQASQKSGATNVFKLILHDTKMKLPPIRNLAELSERLDRRGAADENLSHWCKILLDHYKPETKAKVSLPPIINQRLSVDGVMDFGNISFPCPLMGMNLTVPLKPPLFKDPTTATASYKKNKKSNIIASKINFTHTKAGCRRYSLWSRDLSSLYTASKIASYKSPV